MFDTEAHLRSLIHFSFFAYKTVLCLGLVSHAVSSSPWQISDGCSISNSWDIQRNLGFTFNATHSSLCGTSILGHH